MAKCIMIQGTMSNAGKSFLVAGICRILKQDGYRVAPFKSQNMALNSYITEDGLEMGRAQVMQAEACGIEPTVYMNPILLKPTTDVGSQVIVNGIPRGNMRAADYFSYKTELIPDILHAWQKLSEAYDVIVIEGAGSPAEINLKENDIVNMGLAELVDAPVLLVGDIDRGGVFAQLAGTLALLEEPERQRIRGFVMNKFRGDVEILRPGLDMLRERCHVETIGVIPYAYLDLDDEDSLSERLEGGERKPNAEGGSNPQERFAETLRIAVIRLPRISNFTDFNVLQAMDGVRVSYVSKVSELGEPHMVILPGTKSTIADMRWLRESGLEAAILKLHSRGVTIFGICGGFQMLGEKISDPSGMEAETEEHSESPEITTGPGNVEREKTDASEAADVAGTAPSDEKKEACTVPGISGMGLLPFETVFRGEKVRRRVTGRSGLFSGAYAEASEKRVSGYEIHMGQSEPVDSRNMNKNIPEKRMDSGDWTDEGSFSGNKANSDSVETEKLCGADSPETGMLIFQKENVFGTYVHGVFDEQDFRESFLRAVAKKNGIDLAAQRVTDYRAYKESQYDRLADVVRGGLNMKKFYEILGLYPEKYFSEKDDPKNDVKNQKNPEKENLKNEDPEDENPKKENPDNGDPKKENPDNGDPKSGDPGSKNFGDGNPKNRNLKKRNPESVNSTGKTESFLHLYYGNGKGKTTAAIGLAVRAAGAGKKVVFCQFLKSGESAELSVLNCTPGVRILRSKKRFGFSWTLSEEEKVRLKKIHTDIFMEAMRLAETGLCDVLILDEVCDALGKNLIDTELFYRWFENAKQSGCEWVLTGREPDRRILEAADYVTQMKKERHPFDEGVTARQGIEY